METAHSMNFALFGKSVSTAAEPFIQELVDAVQSMPGEMLVYGPFLDGIRGRIVFRREPLRFSSQEELRGRAEFLISIGGDGTILDAVGLVGDSGIPVAGINLGRLGFLSGVPKDMITPALQAIRNGEFRIEQRSLLRLDAPAGIFGDSNYALNDLTVHKPDFMSLLTIKAWINDEFLNSYWADGLIVSTPTGSTAYSLSCTGPIISPDSENFLITPIASHNLTVRPIIIRDDCRIRIRVEGKIEEYLVSLDARTAKVGQPVELIITRAPFKFNLLRLAGTNFLQAIREKLNWGLDNRN